MPNCSNCVDCQVEKTPKCLETQLNFLNSVKANINLLKSSVKSPTEEGKDYDVMLIVEFELFMSEREALALAKEIQDRWTNKSKDHFGKILIRTLGAKSKEAEL
ncbi:MAG: hypothetical protein LBC64_01785 [Fibromonadaceae bacterium]|jgi:hypothetical protein|nr:hypothetical protein [Fibromonadaceae bacterium]